MRRRQRDRTQRRRLFFDQRRFSAVFRFVLVVGVVCISIASPSFQASCDSTSGTMVSATASTRAVLSNARTPSTTTDLAGRAATGIFHTFYSHFYCYYYSLYSHAAPPIVLASTLPPTTYSLNLRRYSNTSNNILLRSSALLRSLDLELYRGGSQQRFGQHRRNNSNCSGTDNGKDKDDDNGNGNRRSKKTKTKTKTKATDEASNRENNLNPLQSFLRAPSRVSKAVRQGAGAVFSLAGFVGSSIVTLTTDRRSFRDRFVEPVRALNNYLKTSGVDGELAKSFNRRLGVNLCLLGRVHMYQGAEEEKETKNKKEHGLFRANSFASSVSIPSLTPPTPTKLSSSFLEEARRYMKYATAVYGQAMINAAEVDARGRLDGKVGRVTKETISTHIQVPEEDIVLLDVSNLAGNSHHLRHMVVVDHEHKKVVLSLRGTFSLEEIVLDVAAFSREFCGGEAHSEMANMAERVWTVAGPKIKSVLNDNPGYEFILTGHSLGAGAACLLTILLQNKKMLPTEQEIRCFAYASPPVYTPLEFVPRSVRCTTNFVHENDVVPFLSIQKVRKLLTSLQAVDLYARTHMSGKQITSLVLGASPPPTDLIASVLEAEGVRLVPKRGAPTLYVPAGKIVLLKENLDEMGEHSDGSYRYEMTSGRELSQREIRVCPDMLVDHFPSRYEHAFDHLQKQDDEEG